MRTITMYWNLRQVMADRGIFDQRTRPPCWPTGISTSRVNTSTAW